MTETQRAAWPDQLGQRLLKERIVVLGQEVDDEICNRLCAFSSCSMQTGIGRV